MIGSDFERFLERKGKICSVEPLGLPGKFQPPVQVTDDEGLAGYIHRDNVMLELCVLPQADSLSFQCAVNRVLKAASAWLDANAPGYVIGPSAGAKMSPKDLATKEAGELGCDVDFIVGQTDSQPRQPLYAELLGRNRFAGGHLHFSWRDITVPGWVGAAVCDLLIGLREFSYLNPTRAHFYGAAGLHRPTTYPNGGRGVEYRPLDCYWTTSPTHLQRVATRAANVHKVMNEGKHGFLHEMVKIWRTIGQEYPPLVAIGHTPAARDAVEQANVLFRKEFGHDPL